MATDYGVTSGHELYSTHRFRDDTKHMIIFDDLDDNSSPHGGHTRTRLFLTDEAYEEALKREERGEIKRGFFCENKECSFVLWKENRFFAAKKKELTKSVAADLLQKGSARLKGCYSSKTGTTYDATVVLEDDGKHTNFKLEFESR